MKESYSESLTIFNARRRIEAAIDMYYLISADSGSYKDFTFERFNLLWAELEIIFDSLKDIIPDNVIFYEENQSKE